MQHFLNDHISTSFFKQTQQKNKNQLSFSAAFYCKRRFDFIYLFLWFFPPPHLLSISLSFMFSTSPPNFGLTLLLWFCCLFWSVFTEELIKNIWEFHAYWLKSNAASLVHCLAITASFCLHIIRWMHTAVDLQVTWMHSLNIWLFMPFWSSKYASPFLYQFPLLALWFALSLSIYPTFPHPRFSPGLPV